MSTTNIATPFLPRDPCPLPIVESPGSPAADTPAPLDFALLEAWLASTRALQLPLHEIESQQQARGREVQRLLLQAHLERRGDGDVGPALRVPQQAGTVLYTHRRLRTRSLKTIFGPVEINRMGYSRDGAPSIYPLDQALALPARSFSYELQRRLVKAAVQNPFHESVEAIADLTGVSVPKRSLEEILRDAALDFDAFYQERAPAPAQGSILVAAVDGKGIPMVKPGGAQPTVRLTKGQKANRKRMATVAAVFTRAPWVRTPEQVVESLFRTQRQTPGDGQTPPRPENKRVWASLLKSKAAVTEEVAQEMQRRDPEGSKTRVALTDGERALQILVEGTLGVTLILDLLHVPEKLWKAAYVFPRRGEPGSGTLGSGPHLAHPVRRRQSGRQGHSPERRQTRTLRGQAQDAARRCRLLISQSRRMRYDAYLAHGWPIASGPDEGACKNLIKDRMERSGMRWTAEMAEAIVQLRAIYLSGDFDRYWPFHIAKDQQRLHPGHWSVVLK
jgi:hypothetical protein